MEAYEYVVKNNQNETEKGLMWGDSEQEIAIRLKRDGYRIYRISLQDERKKHKWNHTMVVDVTYQLGLLIESGVRYGEPYSCSAKGNEDYSIQLYMNL